MRILFKTPHNIFFRRCFLVHDYEYKDGNLIVKHGFNNETVIPLEGTVLRFIGKK